jgi:mediator of RNA polymerase II transcription subunit 18
MHELFLTAAVTEYDRIRALQILQGYCAMSPVPVLRRRLYFNGSPQHNRGFDPAFIAAQGPKARVWSMLNEQMIRQAYTVVLLYDIDRDQFPKPDTPVEERP